MDGDMEDFKRTKKLLKRVKELKRLEETKDFFEKLRDEGLKLDMHGKTLRAYKDYFETAIGLLDAEIARAAAEMEGEKN